MENSLTPLDMGLSTQVLNNLNTYDDFNNFYIQIDQAVNGFSWMKADMLCAMENKLGSSSLKALSKELGESYSTLVSYIRVARAFLPEQREVGASFSLHFQASFADSYNNETKEFDGEKRFEWRNKAMDNNMSTRTLQKELQESKRPEEPSSDEFYFRRIAEEIRKGISTLTKLSLKGDTNSQKILDQIQSIINEFNSL